jgi:hypothetical protein
MFLTLDVVNKENTILTDKHNRKIQGFKAVVQKEILNLHSLAYVREIELHERFPSGEHLAYPTDVEDIKNKNLCLLTFNFGNVTSEKVVCSSFNDLQSLLSKKDLTK